MLNASNSNLQLLASHDSGVTGLTVDGVGVQTVSVNGVYTGLTFTGLTTTLPNPATYFADYIGTYAAESGASLWVNNDVNGNVGFTVHSMTIASGSAVPEPSTYAALAGLAAFGLVGWRRWRKAAH